MNSFLQSLQHGLAEIMDEDPRVVLVGEDLLDPYGGAFKVTRGLSQRHPGRVLSTPICEASIVGLAAGLSLRGFLPVAEIMFGDFLTLAADQLVNHASKFPLMYGGEVRAPLVVRTPMGGGRGYGPTHSQSLEKHFLGVPGLTVVAPSCAHDPGRLLKTAIRDPGPVLFVEHKLLYPEELILEASDLVRREETAEPSGYPTVWLRNYDTGEPDATLLTYGGVSRFLPSLLRELHREEIRLLAALPSSLAPVPAETLAAAAAASGRVVIAEEGTEGFTWGAEIGSILSERVPGKLRRPVARVASAATVVPAARSLEEEMLISAEKIKEAIFGVLS